MTSTPTCVIEKAAWTAAAKKFRANEGEISKLDGQIASTIGLMRSAGRPSAEIDWATAIAQVSSGAEARSEYNQRMALTYELHGNTQASRLCSMAAKRGDAVEQRPTLDSDQAATEQAYRECVERLVVVSGQKCGQPRTGHGHEGEPCQITLGADGSCQYHGAAVA
jgi:hypothetical protein